MRLLIAEDEIELSNALRMVFEKNNYIVDTVYDGEDALNYALSGNYDGLILDIMMPKLDGLEVLTRLRNSGVSIPVMLLTAKGELPDRIAGFDAGADDYLPKPFAISELLARVRAMLRRRGEYIPNVIEFEGLSLNDSTYELCCGDNRIRLSGREYQMMEMLIENPRHIIPTSKFMERIWGWDSDVDVSIVWVYVSNLRKKLNKIGAKVEIHAMRGVGYSIESVLEN